MKFLIISSSIGIFLSIVLLQSCKDAAVDVTAQIKNKNSSFMAAVEKADTIALKNLYTLDAKLYPANSDIIDGQEAICHFWSTTLKMGIKKVIFESKKAEKYGNLILEEGTYALFIADNQMVDQGKYIVTWKKEGDQWKVFRDIWNMSTPMPVQRALPNEQVLIVQNYVKADKVRQFEDFYKNYLAPSGAEFNPQVKNTVRMLKPVESNKDGTYTYTFIMDPFNPLLNYDIAFALEAKYGKDKASDYVKMYADCLKGGVSQAQMQIETDW